LKIFLQKINIKRKKSNTIFEKINKIRVEKVFTNKKIRIKKDLEKPFQTRFKKSLRKSYGKVIH
jgi:hypothetical protein